MTHDEAVKKLTEMLNEHYYCSCDNERCSRCSVHKEITEEAVALQYALCYLNKE